jgi:hypothetical protein
MTEQSREDKLLSHFTALAGHVIEYGLLRAKQQTPDELEKCLKWRAAGVAKLQLRIVADNDGPDIDVLGVMVDDEGEVLAEAFRYSLATISQN